MQFRTILLTCLTAATLFHACAPANSEPQEPAPTTVADTIEPKDTITEIEPPVPASKKLSQVEIDSIFQLHDSTWVDLEHLSEDILIDIRYATENNFMEKQIYDCGKCYLRLAIAKIVLEMQEELKEKHNLGFKMLDCYRPRSAQWSLWENTPDPRYVADPKKGSHHNRGNTLDLTLVDSLGNQLDMGTPFDYFGKEAYWKYTYQHTEEVQKNRDILLKMMKGHNFRTASTEWWHFTYNAKSFRLSDMRWDCD